MVWTKAQQKVIDIRNKNILVSAAAGSGKTAVLVERIIAMISEGEKPLDVDQLLVVTFTNAAAAEMRERIGKAIDMRLHVEPDNHHLQKQVSLLPSAQITTIHSFCLHVIRNYFHRINLDPSFKLAEEAEITLMKSDVISDILERWYEEGKEEFHAFIESYSYSKSDIPVEELIVQLYNFSMSNPWPKTWIQRQRARFDLSSTDEMEHTVWMKELLRYIRTVLSDLHDKNKEAIAICEEPDGPSAYEAALLADRGILEALAREESYKGYEKRMEKISFQRLSGKREEGVQPWKKERVKELRDEVKKGLKDLTGQFFFQSGEEMLCDLQEAGNVMQVLFDLTLEFMDEFAKKKEEKNLIDFNDLEHFALRILVKEQDGNGIPTAAALELSEQYEEILIDEYQDSNMVQETILKSISREALKRPNRFMVGDVKQSIYKFRLAMPEIFMEKYNTYSCEDRIEEEKANLYQRIDLDMNFRSRQGILFFVNNIFGQLMTEAVGGITYDEAASLKYGELYEENGKPVPAAELLLVTEEEREEEALPKQEEQEPEGDVSGKESEEEAVYTRKEMEARVIARRIKELTDSEKGMMVFDTKSKVYRPAAFRDIVILLRSMSGWSEVFVNTLLQEGIPSYADTGTGYFQTLEIRTVLNMLRIIDNPRQDIPLTGVLYSPMVGLTSTELAFLRSGNRNTGMYSALLNYGQDKEKKAENERMSGESSYEVLENGSREEVNLRDKVKCFLKQLDSFRSMVNHRPIHEILQEILEKTGYYYYVYAMPGGEQRRANIDMLIAQAVRFERGSYSGLFHFIRYIEKLHRYEVDFGEAATVGEQDNTVRIMSIHKSKGLEFPVVVLGGMGKQFNTQDLRSKIVLHNELGVGPEYIDSKKRTKVPTLLKKAIQKKVQVESLGEELRVLYVAMTRAREKLIMTGYIKTVEEIRKKDFSFYELLSAKSYLDWVLPAMVNQVKDMPQFGQENHYEISGPEMKLALISRNQLVKEETRKQLFDVMDKKELEILQSEYVYEPEFRKEIEARMKYTYPFGKDVKLKVKMTVSELKKLGQFQDEEQSVRLYPKETDITIPAFIRQADTIITGADRGTLYHKVLELLDLTRVRNREELLQELKRMIAQGKLDREELKKLNIQYINAFICSNIGDRLRKAAMAGKLYKEQQFVIGIKAGEIMTETDSEELILVQGIIDVYFEENGELVVLDYKSDLVSEEGQLVKRYQVQLQYYKRALEQIKDMKVKEMMIYSLPLAKEIRIETQKLDTL